MPRLPDKSQLGEAAYGTRPIARINATPDIGGEIVGEAIAKGAVKLGETLTKIDVENKKRDDALDLIRAEAVHKNALYEAERSFDNDPEHATYEPRFRQMANASTSDAASLIKDPLLREKWALKNSLENETALNRVMKRGQARAQQEKEVEVENALTRYRNAYTGAGMDDAGRSRIIGDMESTVTLAEKSGLLMPQRAQRLRSHFIEGAVSDDLEERLWKDPKGVLRDLGWVERAAPGSFRAAQEEVTLSDGSTVTLKSPRDLAQIVKVKKGLLDGNKDMSIDGMSPRFMGAMGAMLADMPPELRGAIMIDEAHRSKEYQAVLRRKYETGQGGIAARPGESRHNVGEAVDIAPVGGWKAKTPEYKAALEWMYQNGPRYGINNPAGLRSKDPAHFEIIDQERVRMADATGKTLPAMGPDKGEVEYSDLPAIDPTSRYARLAPHKRHALIYRARTALSALSQEEIKDDVERVRRTGEALKDENGLTALDRASRILSPNQLSRARVQMEEARLEHNAIKPLKNMADEAGEEHLAKILPDAKAPEENYRAASRAYDKAQRAWGKIQETRRKDPALAVNESPEVADVMEIVKSRNPGMQIGVDENGEVKAMTAEGQPMDSADLQERVIEARMEAQERLGIPADSRRPITRREAAQLLPPRATWNTMSDREFKDAIMVAANKAEATYGRRYSVQALDTALGFAVRDVAHADMAGKIIRKMATGDFDPKDVAQYQALQGIRSLNDLMDMGGRAEGLAGVTGGAPFQRTTTDPGRPAISPTGMVEFSQNVTGYAEQEARIKPNESHKQWLRDNPSQWAVFDAKFGRGAAAAALAERK